LFKKKKLDFKDENNKESALKLIELGENDSLLLNASVKYDKKVHQMVETLWEDPSIQEAFKSRYEYHVFDGAEYFLANLKKLAPPNYKPDSEDILRCRRKTIGIVEIQYVVKDTLFKFVDVGGQRNERKKWVNCFEGVTAVLFVTALSDYDQKCYEDDETNRLQESFALFKDISNGEWFSKTVIMLILNKTDVFKNKLKTSPMNKFFEDYDGGDDFDRAYAYIEKEFRKLNKGDQGRIYPHLTCATDVNSVKEVFSNLTSKLIELNVGKAL